jgi:hypothetical protein
MPKDNGFNLRPSAQSADWSSLISSNRLPLLATLLFAVAVRQPKIGQQAPLFTLLDQNRKHVSLAAAAGTKVVLVFYRGYW